LVSFRRLVVARPFPSVEKLLRRFEIHAATSTSSKLNGKMSSAGSVLGGPPATNPTDSQGLVWLHQQALLVFGKDLGKKSLFPYPFPASMRRIIPPIFRRCAFILHEVMRVTLRHGSRAAADSLLAHRRLHQLAIIYTRLGEREKALSLLEKAYETHEVGLLNSL
jgi:hypothetical protein